MQPHRHCPVCGRWYALDNYGRIAVHDSSEGECPGSRESTDLTAKMSKEVERGIAPTPEVLDAARAIVRALTPGGGRTNRVESEDELKHRLAEDGVKIDRKLLAAALEALEVNGEAGGFDSGSLPGLPYRIVRPESRLPPTLLNPKPPTPVVLEDLRPY
jgi:hypothetical protein